MYTAVLSDLSEYYRFRCMQFLVKMEYRKLSELQTHHSGFAAIFLEKPMEKRAGCGKIYFENVK